jgi:glycosyltransferase involved in cell wall biosynthesis
VADGLSVLQVCSASQATYGAVQSLMTLARAQREAGLRVEFLTFSGKLFGDQVRQAGFAVTEVNVRTKIDPLAILKMRKIIRAKRIDVVHTHLSTSSVNGCLAARISQVPGIATVHGMSGKLSFSAASHLIGVSLQVKQHLIDQGVPAAKISVVYNGLPGLEHVPDREKIRAEMGISASTYCFGTIARVTPSKGIEYAIRAIAEMGKLCPLDEAVPSVCYLVVGDGDGLEGCRQLAKELGLDEKVRFLGYRKDIEVCLAAMDLFLFPSLKEAMGIALVEAMRSGLPVVATNIGGIPEVVTEECGILVPPKEPIEMARKALEIVQNPARRSRMADAARTRASRFFSATAMQVATSDVYSQALSQQKGSR